MRLSYEESMLRYRDRRVRNYLRDHQHGQWLGFAVPYFATATRWPGPVRPPTRETTRDLLLHLLYERQGGLCPYCDRLMVWLPAWVKYRGKESELQDLRSREVTLDHVLPQSWGGTNDAKNVVAACRSCNSSKGNRIGTKRPEAA